eukprot:5480825-Lingulodinium_polyedra.AAC.1
MAPQGILGMMISPPVASSCKPLLRALRERLNVLVGVDLHAALDVLPARQVGGLPEDARVHPATMQPVVSWGPHRVDRATVVGNRYHPG